MSNIAKRACTNSHFTSADCARARARVCVYERRAAAIDQIGALGGFFARRLRAANWRRCLNLARANCSRRRRSRDAQFSAAEAERKTFESCAGNRPRIKARAARNETSDLHLARFPARLLPAISPGLRPRVAATRPLDRSTVRIVCTRQLDLTRRKMASITWLFALIVLTIALATTANAQSGERKAVIQTEFSNLFLSKSYKQKNTLVTI